MENVKVLTGLWRLLIGYLLITVITACSTTPAQPEVDQMNEATVLTQILLHEDIINEYFHFEESPERLPLRVFAPTSIDLQGENLSAGGYAVVLDENRETAMLQLNALTVDVNEAVLEFEFTPEGIVGKARYLKQNSDWMLTDLPIVER